MPTVPGKEQLCSCKRNYFTSIQGLSRHTLFERYNDINNVIVKNIDERFRHFLAEPVVEGDSMYWFSVPYDETPQRFSELQGQELVTYEKAKNESIDHYRHVIESLKNENQNSEAESLEKAIKFINDDFLYCFDGKIVLGIWGMKLKENIREPIGTISKSFFTVKNKKTPEPEPPLEPESPSEIDFDTPEAPPLNQFIVHFDSGERGSLVGERELTKNEGEAIYENEVPQVEPKEGFRFTGWDNNPVDYEVTGDRVFTANYEPLAAPPPIPILPWYKRFWNWLNQLFFGSGCLRWLMWLLLLLLIILLLSWLFRGCNNNTVHSIPSPIHEKPWVKDDPRVRDGGGIYDPGNPYTAQPTPPEYSNVLPPNQGVLPPLDTNNIIREPGAPVIINNLLNILMENEDKSILDLAKVFKEKYPDDKYKVVYYDDVVKRMQIEVPPEERLKLKSEIPAKFAPEYELFVFDESLFEGVYNPNDPEFESADKSWYLKAVHAPQAWDITKGSPKLTIAIVDNGFSLKHPELQSKVVMPYNVWSHSKEVHAQTIDHGTHVAGTALGIIDNNQGLCGIAPECAFMPVQVANRSGQMTTTSVLDGVLYALYQGADVVNVSLGMEFSGHVSESEQLDLLNNHFKEEELLWRKVMGIADKHNAIIVVASGNENILAGVNPMSRPKNYIIVSAVDKNIREYQKADFSNFGSHSTLSAPGVDIYSSVGSDSYQIMEGTSMASPIVAGAVALMKSLNEELTSQQIICILQNTGLPVQGKVGNLIQIDKALEKVKLGNFSDCNSSSDKPSTGDVQILLNWNNYNDLDLVCTDPFNQTVWFYNKEVASGGKLEIDMNVNYPDSKTPVENIYWPSGGAPDGNYNVYLVYYEKHTAVNETPYKITVKYGVETEVYTGKIRLEDKSIPICSFALGKAENANTPLIDKNEESLLRQREKLQLKLNQIDSELESYRTNTNIKK